jgi:hypothetical protein
MSSNDTLDGGDFINDTKNVKQTRSIWIMLLPTIRINHYEKMIIEIILLLMKHIGKRGPNSPIKVLPPKESHHL